MKIRTIFLLSFSLLAALSGWFFYRWTTDEIRPSYLKVVEENLVDTSRLMAAIVQDEMKTGSGDFPDFQDIAKMLREDRFTALIYDSRKISSDLEFYMTDRQGVLLFHSHDPEQVGMDYSKWNDVRLTLNGEYGARSTRTDPDDSRTSRLHVAAPLQLGGELIGVITVIKPIDWPYRFIEESRKHALLGAVLLFFSAVVVAFGLSLWLSRPLERLTEHALRVRGGQRSEPPRLGGATEIRRLQVAIEEMRKGLEGREYVEAYVSNLTHEIKSPLSGLRSAAEILREDPPTEDRMRFLGHIHSETARIQRVVDQMLVLAELEGRDVLDRKEILQLPDLIREVIEQHKAFAQAKKIQIVFEEAQAGTITGDRGLLGVALGNILHNAIDFSPAEMNVEVLLADADGYPKIEVRDWGPGIPEFAREKVFDRLFSLPRPGGGAKSSGLGLSLAREIADLHGGKIRISCPDSGGTRVEWLFLGSANLKEK